MKNTKDVLKIKMELKKLGHSEDRINRIIEEYFSSSNSSYVLNYWGIRSSFLTGLHGNGLPK